MLTKISETIKNEGIEFISFYLSSVAALVPVNAGVLVGIVVL